MSAHLFTPFSVGELTLPNRIVVSPMCQYAATDGVPGNWHLAHLGQFAMSGPGAIFVESTGVSPDGRITAGCTGLYNEACEKAFSDIIAFMKSVGESKVGIQLSHAGRKGSTVKPWEGGGLIEGEGAWETIAPSPIPYLAGWPEPLEMDDAALKWVKKDFVDAAIRADRAGFDMIELHCAHGYLLHQFLSPLTNKRSDAYGGSLENRMRYPLEIFTAVRAAFDSRKPVLVRLSATDWIESGWDMAGSLALAAALKEAGCDALDVTSGGLDQRQTITTGPGYQVGFAEQIRRQVDIPVMAVGQISQPTQAETIIATGQADMVALARGMLWDPRWTWKAALELGVEIALPAPYARCNPALAATPFVTRSER